MVAPHRDRKSEFINRVLVWGFENSPAFPWRRSRNPFDLLVAELLLRKTSRKQVATVYRKIMRTFPTCDKLSRADGTQLVTLVRPLGMQRSRSKLLRAMATRLQREHKGIVPKDEQYLLKLPGVGKYIASAVRCFSFGESVPLVDTNVARIIHRVFSIETSTRPRDDKMLWDFAGALVPKRRAAEFNYALLDFGAAICRTKPLCQVCPLLTLCDYGIGHRFLQNS